MRRYETILIVHPDVSEDDVGGLVSRYSDIIAAQKGIIAKIERWGKRKLAYLIRKQTRGNYVLIDYAGTSATVNELERNLKIEDRILKFMTVLTSKKVEREALEKEIAEKAKEASSVASPAPAAALGENAAQSTVETSPSDVPAPANKEE